jgi:hypothetical protein
LALLYRQTLRHIEQLTPGKIERLHIVGGGSNNDLLNQFTANAVQIPVLAGPAEATAALKDRQGVTHQYMSVPGGDPVHITGNELSIQQVGALPRPITSEDSDGNGFKIFVRDIGEAELTRKRASLASVL